MTIIKIPYTEYLGCEICGFTTTSVKAGDKCENHIRCKSHYVKLNNYIVAIEHPDYTQDFLIVPGITPKDALKRIARESPGAVRDAKKTYIGKLECVLGKLSVGLLGELDK